MQFTLIITTMFILAIEKHKFLGYCLSLTLLKKNKLGHILTDRTVCSNFCNFLCSNLFDRFGSCETVELDMLYFHCKKTFINGVSVKFHRFFKGK